jgi:hypothetical protein
MDTLEQAYKEAAAAYVDFCRAQPTSQVHRAIDDLCRLFFATQGLESGQVRVRRRRRMAESDLEAMVEGSMCADEEEKISVLEEFTAEAIASMATSEQPASAQTGHSAATARTAIQTAADATAKRQKQYKLLAEEVRTALGLEDHFRMIRLARDWEPLGATRLHDALQEAGLQPPIPKEDQTTTDYARNLPHQDRDYCNRTLDRQISHYRKGKKLTSAVGARDTLRFVRELAEITVERADDDAAENEARHALGLQLHLTAYSEYASFFETGSSFDYWSKTAVAFRKARNHDEFQQACDKAEQKTRDRAIIEANHVPKATTTPTLP